MRVVPVGVGVLRQAQPRKAAIGAVQDIHAHFVLHHALLVGEAGGVDVEATHTVCFHPQHRLQYVRGHYLKVVGVVEAGAAIQRTTVAGDDLVQTAFRQIRRALEHHVFEQVREASAALRFNAETDLVVHADRRRRQGSVAREHDAQPVGQAVVLNSDLQTGGGRCCWRSSTVLAGSGRRGADDQHGSRKGDDQG